VRGNHATDAARQVTLKLEGQLLGHAQNLLVGAGAYFGLDRHFDA
jgi:hypothetical protein